MIYILMTLFINASLHCSDLSPEEYARVTALMPWARNELCEFRKRFRREKGRDPTTEEEIEFIEVSAQFYENRAQNSALDTASTHSHRDNQQHGTEPEIQENSINTQNSEPSQPFTDKINNTEHDLDTLD